MIDENVKPEDQNAAPEQPATKQADASVAQPQQSSTQKRDIVTMPSKALAALKREERQRGQAQLARDLGFESIEAMREATAAARSGAAPQQNSAAPKTGSDAPSNEPDLSRSERQQLKALQEQNARLKRENVRLTKLVTEARRERDEVKAESELRSSAIGAGVRDVDYALHLFKRHISGLTEEQLEALDEGAFFAGLKSKYGYIFSGNESGQTDKPLAHTTPTSQPKQPQQPQREEAPRANANSGGASKPFDARSATPQELAAHYARLGLQAPGTGSYS